MRPAPSLHAVATRLDQRRRRYNRARRLWRSGLLLLGLGLLFLGWWATHRRAPHVTPPAAVVAPAGRPARLSGVPGGACVPWRSPGSPPSSWNLGPVRTAPASRCRLGARPARSTTSLLPGVRRGPGARRSPPRDPGSALCPSAHRCPCRAHGRSLTFRPQGGPRRATTPWAPAPPPPVRRRPVPRSTPSAAPRPRPRGRPRAGGRGGGGPRPPGDRRRPSHPSSACRTMRLPSWQSPSASRWSPSASWPAREHTQQTSLRREGGYPVESNAHRSQSVSTVSCRAARETRTGPLTVSFR